MGSCSGSDSRVSRPKIELEEVGIVEHSGIALQELDGAPERSGRLAAGRTTGRAGRRRPAPRIGVRSSASLRPRPWLPPAFARRCIGWRRKLAPGAEAPRRARAYLSYASGSGVVMPARPRPPLASMCHHFVHAHLAGLDAHVEDRLEQIRLDAGEAAHRLVLARPLELQIAASRSSVPPPLAPWRPSLSKSPASSAVEREAHAGEAGAAVVGGEALDSRPAC